MTVLLRGWVVVGGNIIPQPQHHEEMEGGGEEREDSHGSWSLCFRETD